MKGRIGSWIFFTSVLLLFLGAAVSLPGLRARWMGQTLARAEAAAEEMEAGLWAVWAEASPWSRR